MAIKLCNRIDKHVFVLLSHFLQTQYLVKGMPSHIHSSIRAFDTIITVEKGIYRRSYEKDIVVAKSSLLECTVIIVSEMRAELCVVCALCMLSVCYSLLLCAV